MTSTRRKAVACGSSQRLLTGRGLRATSQRGLILDVIRRRGGHLDADEIHREARKREPRISLSTVYRTLQRFKELGLIEELHLDEGHHHYEMKPTTEHHHLVCLGCGRVVEFCYPLAERLKKGVSEIRDFEIRSGEITLSGYCPECRKKRSESG